MLFEECLSKNNPPTIHCYHPDVGWYWYVKHAKGSSRLQTTSQAILSEEEAIDSFTTERSLFVELLQLEPFNFF